MLRMLIGGAAGIALATIGGPLSIIGFIALVLVVGGYEFIAYKRL